MVEFVNVNILGGLCNQLFVVATCLSYAWKNNLKPIFIRNEHAGLPSHTKLYWGDFLIKLKDYVVDTIPTPVKEYHSPSWNHVGLPDLKDLSVEYPRTIRLNGYFQSELNFKEYRSDILKLFRPPNEQQLNEKYTNLIKNVDNIGIMHIRRGDFQGLQNFHPLMTVDYYKRGRKTVESKLGRKLQWYIISEKESYDWIKQQKVFRKCVILNNEKDYEDLWMITYFKYIIMANSTFSWWGVWLSDHKEKIVISPKKWFGPDGPHPFNSIYLDDWIIM